MIHCWKHLISLLTGRDMLIHLFRFSRTLLVEVHSNFHVCNKQHFVKFVENLFFAIFSNTLCKERNTERSKHDILSTVCDVSWNICWVKMHILKDIVSGGGGEDYWVAWMCPGTAALVYWVGGEDSPTITRFTNFNSKIHGNYWISLLFLGKGCLYLNKVIAFFSFGEGKGGR